MSLSRAGSDTSTCELCGIELYWDWVTNKWLHVVTDKVECADPEHQEHYE